MKHIVVPVDLSPNAKDAVKYAGHIAHASGAGLTLVYAHSLLQKAVNYTIGKGKKTKNPEKWLDKRIARMKADFPGIQVKKRIVMGDIVDFLKPILEETSADFVVMGCQGQYEEKETYLGTTAGAVVKTTDIPVLLIPSGYRFTGLDRVVFAAKNTGFRNQETIQPLIELKQIFTPHIQLLHLGENQDSELEYPYSILQLVHDVTRYGNDSFNESINEYLSQHPADLICAFRRKRGFLERKLGPTKTFSHKFYLNVPFLVLVGEDY